jgi:hypothetical protein
MLQNSKLLLRDQRGVAAIEFGIVSAALLILFIAVVDLGIGFYRKMQVQSAAQRAAIYASIRGFNAAGISGVITASRGAPLASPVPRQFCACPTSAGLTELSCTSTCSVSIGGVASTFKPGLYVGASARSTYTPILRYPTLSSPLTFESTQVVRIR